MTRSLGRGLTWWPGKITQEQKGGVGKVAGPGCFEDVFAGEGRVGISFWVDPRVLCPDEGQGVEEGKQEAYDKKEGAHFVLQDAAANL